MRSSKKGAQLSMFNDRQVKRSFLCRMAFNPKKDIIIQLRMENLFGLRTVIDVESHYAGMSHFSANRHFLNKHNPFIKEGKKYYYD